MEEIRVLGRLALATTYVETKAGVRPVWPASQNVHMHMHMHMHMCMHMCMCPHVRARVCQLMAEGGRGVRPPCA